MGIYGYKEKIYEHYHKGYAFESTNWKDLDFQTVELKEVIRGQIG